MDKINVVINGILGKMGQEVAKAVSQESDMCAVSYTHHLANETPEQRGWRGGDE